MFIGIAHLAFMGLHLFSFSSPCYPVLIAYLSSLFQIPLFIAHDTVTFEFTTLTSSFLYFRGVRPLVIFDMVFRVTFGDVLEGA
ncbi:hypothetical protein AAG906_007800 [Vitis piasezkii]